MASSLDTASTNAPSRGFGANLDGLAAWSTVQDGDPLTIRSTSAAAIAIAETADGLRLAAGDASITLDRSLRATTTGNTVFDDGSVLVVGDDAAGGAHDDAGNVVRIARDFAAALDRDNRILGLGGDDDLTGGGGDDRVAGGTGADRLRRSRRRRRPDRRCGRRPAFRRHAATTTLRGGAGADVLVGGPGRDALTGGSGHDLFRFRDGDSPPGAADVIHDFDPDRDTIDLRADRRHRRRSQFRLRLDRPRELLGHRRRAQDRRPRRRPLAQGRYRRRRPGRPRASCSTISTGLAPHHFLL